MYNFQGLRVVYTTKFLMLKECGSLNLEKLLLKTETYCNSTLALCLMVKFNP